MVIRHLLRNCLLALAYAALAPGWMFPTSTCRGQSPAPAKKKVDAEPNVTVIPLRGSVGLFKDDFDAKASRTQAPDFVTAEILKGALEEAHKGNPQAIILEVSGPGGSVSEMLEMVKMLMTEQDNKQRLIAWIGPEVLSADAEIALACKELVVKSQCQIGACVVWATERNGKRVDVRGDDNDPVARKMYSALISPVQQAQDKAGRPRCIEEAMRVMGTELWWSPQKGLAASKGAGAEWEQVDGAKDVLTLSSEQLLKYGLAIGKADTDADLLDVLKLPPTTKVKRLDSKVKSLRHTASQRAKNAWKKVDDFVESLVAIDERLREYNELIAQGNRLAAKPKISDCHRRVIAAREFLERAKLDESTEADFRQQLGSLENKIKSAKAILDISPR